MALACQKYVLLVERPELGLQSFAPDAGMLSFEEIRHFLQKRHQVRRQNGLPEETFFLAQVSLKPLVGSAIEAMWDEGAETRYFPQDLGGVES